MKNENDSMDSLPDTVRRFAGRASAIYVALAVAGCSTMKVPEFKVADTASYRFTAETNGLLVAVQPVTQKDQVKETFRTDLVGKGIIPILVVVENRSESSVMLAKEKVFVIDPSAAASTNTASLGRKVASGSAGEQTALAGGALLGVAVVAAPAAVVVAAPLLVAGMKAMSNADVIRHNLADKALASHTIAPGDRAYGYLYFELPKGAQLGNGQQVVVELNDTAADKPLTFLFDVQ